MVERHIGRQKDKENKMANVIKLADESISQIVRLRQMGILTGTDVTDQLRTLELVIEGNSVKPSDDYLEMFENNLKAMEDSISEYSD